jgi:hypothetical protein
MKKPAYRLKPFEAIALGLEIKNNDTDKWESNPKYYLNSQEERELLKLRNLHESEFKEVKRTLNKDGEVITKVEKLTSKELIEIPSNHQIKRVSTNVATNQQWVITEPIKVVDVEKEIDFLSIFKDKIEPIVIKHKSKNIAKFDRAVFTDTHIGMDVNKDGFSLYDGLWNESEIFKRLEIFVNEIIKNKKSNTLFLNDLADFLDGWDAETTRGGHKLPQNMDNQKAFDVALIFKIRLVDALLHHYNFIKFVNICNDNHAGSFGYIVNSAFKTYIELKYPNNIEVINQRKFIDHYIINNRCFILTHGKDNANLKFGFKPKLDAIQIEKIKNYIDEYKLHNYKIEFSKGDSHQLLFDHTSSTAFEYQNFGAFSPPSDWVKTNFKNTLSSFTTFNYYETQKTINHFIF